MSTTASKPRRPDGSVAEAFRHGRYNLRDQLGHYVQRADAADRPCHHLCCEGKRVHPDKLPVKLSRTWLRSLTEPELERELSEYGNYSESHEEGYGQVLAEIDRREMSEKRAAARKMRARERRLSREGEYQDEVYRQWLTAEAATNGFMLNKAGQRAGINERSLFTGPESRVHKYASPELMDWFEAHGRPTRVSWFGSAAQRRAYHAGTRLGR
jgi:hypothetical protein